MSTKASVLAQSSSLAYSKHVVAAIIVASLGYFVDIYDLILFSIVRLESLQDIGLTGQELTDKGLLLINIQMLGMLIGGVIFGILGDKRGRLSVLFGSILLYSLANIANGMVHSVAAYAVLRFIAGVGLAGELGAGVTLVSEILPRGKRGWGTTIIASVGICGAILAWYIAEKFDWRTAYFIGGGLGLLLLFLRIGVAESGLYQQLHDSQIHRGDFLSLFTKKDRFVRFAASILMGVQLWYVIGILITFSAEFAKQLAVQGDILPGRSVLFCYSGLVFGDFTSGLLSQFLQSRKLVAGLFQTLSAIGIFAYFHLYGLTVNEFYLLCFLLGIASGYWAIFVTVAAEQFGTNLRATVATSVPNFVRGSLVPISAMFAYTKASWGLLQGGFFVGIVCIVISFIGLWKLRETFHSDLNYLER